MRSSPYLVAVPLAALLAALLAACGGGADLLTATPQGGGVANVTVARAASGLRISNAGTAPLALTVFERNYAALVLWGPCIDPGPTCVRLPAGQTVTVPYAEIGGYTSGAREVIVYTWRVVPVAGGGYRAADFASVVVRL